MFTPTIFTRRRSYVRFSNEDHASSGLRSLEDSYSPYSTPLWNRFGLFWADFTDLEGNHLFRRIGWKGRVWQVWGLVGRHAGPGGAASRGIFVACCLRFVVCFYRYYFNEDCFVVVCSRLPDTPGKSPELRNPIWMFIASSVYGPRWDVTAERKEMEQADVGTKSRWEKWPLGQTAMRSSAPG